MRWSSAFRVALLVLAAVSAQAQRTPPRAPQRVRCSLDSSAAWFAKQRAWFDDSKRTWSDDTLRTSLLRAAGLSAVGTVSVQTGRQIDGVPSSTTANDSAAIAQLKQLASTRGATWPTRAVVGATGTRAVWLLAHRDTALARAALKRMMEAGPEESNAADVATLEDRLRLQSGRKQLYGTQFRAGADGRLVLAPMEDSAHVDLRREEAGLPPFRVSACLAKRAAAAQR